ncbi:DUF2510 domain-containing protein [Kitasatospora sp. NPDC048365]|uniref:DUF2510 domain-containing protein n=1 Tax=Kitasatospora sp. NPDC048365 TaxID=3364050 RepID=UPI0037226ECF
MSTPTPPGWYPVPGTTEERWWDGTAWTADTRPAHRIADAPTQAWPGAAVPPMPSQQPAPQPSPPRRNGLVIGATVASLAVIGGAIAAAVAFIPGGDPDPTPSRSPIAAPSASRSVAPSRSASASPRPSASRSAQPAPSGTALSGKALDDRTHGWSVPIANGWVPRLTTGTTSTVFQSVGEYECGQTSKCVRGQYSVEVSPSPGTDARTVAEAVMAVYAPRSFGDLEDHEELGSGTITVAGAKGYAVRWHVTPTTGEEGYLLVVAVPAAGGGYTILHGGVDDSAQAPDPVVLDQITAGIRALGSGSGT